MKFLLIPVSGVPDIREREQGDVPIGEIPGKGPNPLYNRGLRTPLHEFVRYECTGAHTRANPGPEEVCPACG